MFVFQIYINGERADMFKDESVTLTQSIQNVRDVGKIFTDFTQSFNLPASKTNNKIFKHFYNFNIDSGFDARSKITCTIELNYLKFKTGVLQLNGVKMTNNSPESYKVTFFGNTVNLKTLIGDDKLDALNLSASDHNYSKDIVKQAIQSDTYINSGAVLYPLIQALGNRYTFNSASGNTDAYNLAYRDSGAGTSNTGVSYTDLKPALRLQEIIDAIETAYSITFSNDFFNNNEPFASLYLWLSRNKGRIGTDTKGQQVFTKILGDWIGVGTPQFNPVLLNTLWYVTTDSVCKTVYEATLTIASSSSTVYTIYAIDTLTGVKLAEKSNVSGNNNLALTLHYSTVASYVIQWVLETTESMTFTPSLSIELQILSSLPSCGAGTFTNNYNCGGTLDALSIIYINQNVPDIKVIDFLTGIFQTFNLTAFVNDSNTIVVKTLDNFYAGGSSYDITQFVDANSSDVNMALPYNDIQFKFQEPDSFLAINFQRINNLIFGDLLSPPTRDTSIDVGTKYTIELPFSKMVYERLSDANPSSALTNNLSEIQWGWSANADQESDLIKPLIFYNVNQTISDANSKLSFVDGANQGNAAAGLSTFNRPSNVNLNSTQTINFGAEVDEYVGTINSNSLFQNYYNSYITDVFNIKRRMTKVKAFLPLQILLNYTLADRFIINNQSYKINSVKTNFLTGTSDIELLNEL